MPVQDFKFTFESKEQSTTNKDLIRVLTKLEKTITAQKGTTGADRDMSALKQLVSRLINTFNKQQIGLGKQLDDLAVKLKVEPNLPPVGNNIDIQILDKSLKSIDANIAKLSAADLSKKISIIDLETGPIKSGGKLAGKVDFITQIGVLTATLRDVLTKTEKQLREAGRFEEINIRPKISREEYDKGYKGTSIEGQQIKFNKLLKEGKPIEEALKKVAAILEDSAIIAGHNITGFDAAILNDALKDAKINIDLAGKEFYDTLKAARKAFPTRSSHTLPNLEKDLVSAGRKFTGVAHEAEHDVAVTADLMKALAGSSIELNTTMGNVASEADKLASVFSKVEKDIIDAGKQIKSSADNLHAIDDPIQAAGESLEELSIKAADAAKITADYSKKAEIRIKDLAKVRSMQATVFQEAPIFPTGQDVQYKQVNTVGAKVNDKLQILVDNLSKSLSKLQTNIVKSLESGLRSGWKILQGDAGEKFQLAKGGREWELTLVDVGSIRKQIKQAYNESIGPEVSSKQAAELYKEFFMKDSQDKTTSKSDIASLLARWLSKVGPEDLAKTSKATQSMAKQFRGDDLSKEQLKERVKGISTDPALRDIYRATVLEAEATDSLRKQFFKTIAVPAARLTPQGTIGFETKYGAERSLAGFATITTGLERLASEFKDLNGDYQSYLQQVGKITKLPFRPDPVSQPEVVKEAIGLATTLIDQVKTLGGKQLIHEGLSSAVQLRMVERGMPTQGFETTDNSLESLELQAKKLGVTSLDVATALNQINYENFYDVLDRLYQVGKIPFITEKAMGISGAEKERSVRQIASIKDELLGIMPLVDPGRPKRRAYDEDVVKILTRKVASGSAFSQTLRPEEQKKHIVDVALVWQEMADNARKLGRTNLYSNITGLGIPEAKPIDLSDSASSQIKEFNSISASALRDLNKTVVSASTAGIRGLAPFEKFSSINRQMSYSANALIGALPKGKFELPSLVSQGERGMIESGKYGTGGYGLNVLTELRSTAATYEDQIVISGRLAEAFTRIVKPLVGPAASIVQDISSMKGGKIVGATARGKALEAGTRGVSSKNFEKLVGKVTSEYQEVLGVPKSYPGRADIAQISDEIKNVMRMHRGESIEVQTAKLSETFLNYFGRKLSTRFGTKGVSISAKEAQLPEGISSLEDVASFMKRGFETKVAPPGTGLGIAKMPKSIGELVSELLENELGFRHAPEAGIELHSRLVKSGNKFIIDMFKDASEGLVTKEEAAKQAKLFQDASEAFRKTFGVDLPEGKLGIEKIRKLYGKRFGEEKLSTLQPIEARISARGVAKRGLMPEVLEGMVNNLIGSIKESTTILDTDLTADPGIRKRLNEYSAALDYSGLDPDERKSITGRIRSQKGKITDEDERIAFEETLKNLDKFEKQWKIYTDVVDEYGNKIKSFVAPKFLQIIEEPHFYKEWSQSDISKGVKGEKLNFQAFAAYTGVFGEGSQMMEELSKATSLTSREGWELIRAMQMLDPAMKSLSKNMMQGLQSVNIADIKDFTDRTAEIGDLSDTIFDIGKYPAPFKLKIPSTVKGALDKYTEEDIYIPGPSVRATYPEELMGGQRSPTNVARYLSNLVSAAKKVEDITTFAKSGDLSLDDEGMHKFATTIRGELTKKLTSTYKEFAGIEEKRVVTPANLEFMSNYVDKLKLALSSTRSVAPVYMTSQDRKRMDELGPQSELEAVESYEDELRRLNPGKMYSRLLSRIMDIMIGAQPDILKNEEEKIARARKKYAEAGGTGLPPAEYQKQFKDQGKYYGSNFPRMLEAFQKRVEERRAARPAFDVELEAGNLDEFANNVGINLQLTVKDSLEKALQSLSRAKISYTEELAKQVIGPKHAVEQTFFQRVIPFSITAKAVTAVTDKTIELNNAISTLEHSGDKSFGSIIKNLETVRDAHKKYIDKAKKMGTPVLREGEIGIHPEMAKQIKLKQGGRESDLFKLINEQLEEAFVTTVRYPFTGTLSVQPHKAKLMEEGLSRHTLAVPGAPEMDITSLEEGVIKPLEERLHKLVGKREQVWERGGEDAPMVVAALSEEIKGLITLIRNITPKYVNMEQKLDFDGDALFLHTGQVEESRIEIQKHFKSLGSDVSSVRSLFNTLFTAVGGAEVDVKSLSEMAYVFSKKQPAAKGYSFLEKPYIEKEVKSLNLNEVFKALLSYEKGIDIGDYLTTSVLPGVFEKAGGTAEEHEMFTQKAKAGGGSVLLGPDAGEFEKVAAHLLNQMARRRLWEQKYSDAIVGQLYKLQTGQTVEGISRVARLTELETGFGGGLAGTGKRKFDPAKEFLEKWPKKSIVLGDRPVQEFAARMNEILRFVIQKGLDEKHAGVEAVGKHIISNVGKEGGAAVIMKIMEEEKEQFGELSDFNKKIAQSASLRLGAHSTDELRKELQGFQPDLADDIVSGMSREQLIAQITKQVDLSAVFEELFRMIKRQAIKGYMKELRIKLEEMPIERRSKTESEISRVGGFEPYARQHISQKAKSETGISILKYVTTNLEPLYKLRTSMETIGSVASRTGLKPSETDMLLPGNAQEVKRLKTIYEDTLKTAHVLSRSMEGIVSGAQGGTHSMMVLSSVQKRLMELDALAKKAEELGVPMAQGAPMPQRRMDFAGGAYRADAPALFADVWAKADLSQMRLGPIDKSGPTEELQSSMEKLKEIKKQVKSELENMSQALGIPMMGKEEEQKAFFEFREGNQDVLKSIDLRAQSFADMIATSQPEMPQEQVKKTTEEYAEFMKELLRFQISMSEQSRRLSEAMKAVPFQKTYLEQSFPGLAERSGKSPTDIANAMSSMEDIKSKEFDQEMMFRRGRDTQDWFDKQKTSTAQSFVDSLAIDQPQMIPSRDLEEKVRQAAEESIIQIAQTVNESVIYKTRQALKGLAKAAGGPEVVGPEVKLSELYRASGIHGGGGYGGVPQPEAILKQMLGLSDPNMLMDATALRGTALHRRKQLEMGEKFKQSGGFEVEGLARYAEEGQDVMTGHFDVIYKEAEGAQKRLADIKTVYSGRTFDALAKLADNIGKGGITLESALMRFEESQSKFDQELARRIRNYISQINFYLQSNQDAIGEIILISSTDPTKEATIELGQFDPALFAKDIQTVKDARAKVSELLGALSKTSDPAELQSILKGYGSAYQDLSGKLGDLTFENVSAALPTRPTFEAMEKSRLKGWEEFANTLSKEDQILFEELSVEYLTAFERMSGPRSEQMFKQWRMAGIPAGGAGGAGVPPGGAGGGAGGGDGFDDDGFEELKKRIQDILARLRRGIDVDSAEIIELMKLFTEARTRFSELLGRDDADQFKDLAQQYDQLSNEIRQTVSTNYKDGFESAHNMYQNYKKFSAKMAESASAGEKDFSYLRDLDIETDRPDRPEAMHKNLRALFTVARRRHGLVDSDTKRFGEDIQKLIESVSTGGPSADISRDIIAAVDKLPKNQRGYTVSIWKHYRRAVSEYFLKELDRLKSEIENAKTEGIAGEAFAGYEQTLKRFRETILKNLGKASDIYTEKGFGGSKQIIAPKVARLTGLYRTKDEIAEIARAQSHLSGEFQPIVDMLIGDTDAENIEHLVPPIEKVRKAFELLTIDAEDLKKTLRDDDAFRRFGDQIANQWDFSKVVEGVTQIRAAMESWNRMQISGFGDVGPNPAFSEAQRKNIEETIKLLRQLEKAFVPTGGDISSDMGMVGVPGFLSTDEQEVLHRRNIAQARRHFATPEDEGGPQRGRAFNYRYKIVDPSTKQVISNMSEEFRSLGTTVDSAGQKMGIFTQKTADLLKQFQNRQGFGQAFGRVIRWGMASSVVWGSVKALQGMVGVVTDVEYGIAVLRQVMSPLESDFEGITMAAINFAKDFGLPIQSVIDSMRVFAQQGLSQVDIIDRTRTSSIAANVTTLTSSDATEALTAATKVYGREGQSTLRFLDSWSQVEARHAITSADLANAMKKAAAAAKTSGVDFDQLNAIVTGIGETSRQTGKEVGTSLRFMFRRLQGSKGPKELGKLGIPVIGETGDIRSAFTILDELSTKWDTLSMAQRLSIAQAIGGRRHYNSLIILMDHWNDVLDTLQDSMNSKGAAERRNAIVMDTYAKKLQQVRGALVELQVQFGKIALPVAKGVLTGFKFLLETISNIPVGFKTAALAVAGFFALVGKGEGFVQGFANKFSQFGNIMGDFFGQLTKQFKVGIFETFGKLPAGLGEMDTKGLKTIMDATSMRDMESALGKGAYLLTGFGRSWNDMMSEIVYGGASISEALEKVFGKVAVGLAALTARMVGKGGPLGAIATTITGGLSAGFKGSSEIMEQAAKIMGVPAEKLAEWTQSNTGFVKSVIPMIASIAGLIPLTGKLVDQFKKLAFSAEEYEKSTAGLQRKLDGELETIRNLGRMYESLESNIAKVSKLRDPEVAQRALEREEYKGPIKEMAKQFSAAQKFGNALSDTNYSLVESFDKFGNAVLRTTTNFKEYVSLLESAKIQEIAETQSNVLEKYIGDLTKRGGSETLKYEFKRLVTEIPALGPVLGKGIKVSPAKELEVSKNRMNKILQSSQKFPMSSGFDAMFKKYNADLDKTRMKYNEVYQSFKRVLTGIDTTGLTAEQIKRIFDKPEFKEGFKLMVELEPVLKDIAMPEEITWKDVLNGKAFYDEVGMMKRAVDWKDILGVEILRRIHPNIEFGFAAPLTKELMKERGLMKRSTEAFAGDVVLFMDELPKRFDVAGKQGVLKFTDTMGYVVEYVDKEMRTVKQVPFDAVSKFVDSVFPVQAIADRLDENLELLEEHLTGAAAGMIGITDKEFKRTFSLGERFFSQVPTTTLLQGSKGYNPLTGTFGEQESKAGYRDLLKENFFGPMAELKNLIELPKQRGESGAGVGPGLAEDIAKLQKVVQNNQVVVQYMALFEDLTKTMSEGARALKENLVAEEARNQYMTQSAGILRGLPEGLTDINTGVRDFSELTAQQRILFNEQFKPPSEREFTNLRRSYEKTKLQRDSKLESLISIRRAKIQLDTIRAQAKGFGAALPANELMSITKAIAKAGSRPEGVQLAEMEKVTENTGATVSRLDDLLVLMKSPASGKIIADRVGKVVENIDESLNQRGFGVGTKEFIGIGKVPEKIDRLFKMREAYKDRPDLVRVIDAGINRSIQLLESRVGPEQIMKQLGVRDFRDRTRIPSPVEELKRLTSPDPYSRYKGRLTQTEYVKRTMGGVGIQEFMQTLSRSSSLANVTGSEQLIKTISDVIRHSFFQTFNVHLKGSIGRYQPKTDYQRLQGTSEYKELTKAIQDQTNISVTTSKNIMGLFAGYAGFQDIMRRASRREERYYDVQITQARGRQKEALTQFRAGDLPKDEYRETMKSIAGEIKDLTTKKKLAVETAEERGTQEAIYTIATASIGFAKAVGVSEDKLSFLGKAAIGAVIAWNAWSALTGKEMPEVIKTASEKMKEYAKKLGDEAPGFFDKVFGAVGKKTGFGVGAAGDVGVALRAVEKDEASRKKIFTEEERRKIAQMKDLQVNKDQIKKTDEAFRRIKEGDVDNLDTNKQALGVNKDQLSALLAIEENTRKSEDQSETQTDEAKKQTKEVSYTKELRDKLDAIKSERIKGGNIGTQIRDFLTVAVLVTGARYTGELSAFNQELANTEEKSKKLASAFETLISKYPNEIAIIIKEMKEEQKAKAAAIGGGPETTEVSRLLDTEKFYQKYVEKIMAIDKKMVSELEGFAELSKYNVDNIRLKELGEDVAKQMEAFGLSIIKAAMDITTNLQYSLQRVGQMKGLPNFEELDVGKTMGELTPTERLMKLGGSEWRQMYQSYKILDKYYQGLIGMISSNNESIMKTNYTLAAETEGSKRFVETQKGKFKSLQENYKKVFEFRKETTEAGGERIRGRIAPEITEDLYNKYQDKMRTMRLSLEAPDRVEDIISKQKRAVTFIKGIRASNIEEEHKQDLLGKVTHKLGGYNKQMAEMLKLASTEKLAQATIDLANKENMAAEKTGLWASNTEQLEQKMDPVNTSLERLSNAFASGLHVSQFIGELDKLEESLVVSARAAELDTTSLDKMIGGSHPLARQRPTYEMMVGAGALGQPLESAFFADKYQKQALERAGAGRSTTAEDRLREAAGRRLDKFNLKQDKANQAFQTQFRGYEQAYASAVGIQEAARRRPGMEGLVTALDPIIANLKEQIEKAPEVIRTDAGGYEREGFGNILEKTKGSLTALLDKFKIGPKTFDPLVQGILKSGDSTVAALSAAVGILHNDLKAIGEAIGVTMRKDNYLADFIGMKRGYEVRAQQAAQRQAERVSKSLAQEAKATGGIISGPGGPKSDSIRINASAGEFVIRASSAKKIGYDTLSYLNESGQVPAFQSGGFIEDPKTGKRWYIKDLPEPTNTALVAGKPIEIGGRKYEITSQGLKSIDEGYVYSKSITKPLPESDPMMRKVDRMDAKIYGADPSMLSKVYYGDRDAPDISKTDDYRVYRRGGPKSLTSTRFTGNYFEQTNSLKGIADQAKHYIPYLDNLKVDSKGYVAGKYYDQNKEEYVDIGPKKSILSFLKDDYYGPDKSNIYEAAQKILQKIAGQKAHSRVVGYGLTPQLKAAGIDTQEKLEKLLPKDFVEKYDYQSTAYEKPLDVTEQVIEIYNRMKKSMGGKLESYGQGGDIPIMVSNGEFLLNKLTVDSIGLSTVEGMNKTGVVPGLAEGGMIQSYKDGNKVLSTKNYQGIHNYFTTDEENVETPKWDKKIADHFTEMIGKREELDAYYLAEKLKTVDNWKDYYNAIVDLADQNEKLSNTIFKSIPAPIVKDKKSGLDLKRGMMAISGGTRAAQMKEINKSLDGKYDGGLVGFADGGGLTREQFESGVIRAPDKSEDFWRSVKEFIPFANYQEKKLNDPEALMNQSAMLADMFLPSGKLGMSKKILGPLQKHISKLSSSVFKKKNILKSPEEIVNYFKEGLDKGEKGLTTLGFELGESMRGKGSVSSNASLLKKARELLFEEAKLVKDVDINKYAYLSQVGQGPREAMESLVGKRSVHGDINTQAKEWVTEYLKTGNIGEIPQYKQGTSYVPRDQLAYLHQGEQVLPAMQTGGKISALDPKNIAEEIKTAIEDAIKDTKIELNLDNIPESIPVSAPEEPIYVSMREEDRTLIVPDIPPIKVSDDSIARLEGVLATPVKVDQAGGAVGAETAIEIRDIKELLNERLTAFEAIQIDQIDQIIDLTYKLDSSVSELNMKTEDLSIKYDDVDGKVITVTQDLTNVKFKSEDLVSGTELTTRLDKMKSDIDVDWRTEVNSLSSNINILDVKVSDVDGKTNEQFDQINSLANRVGIM